ncbi:MAG: 50S ribosomal protein L24 [Verrucomicrobiota bacterium]|jgi:large subunit ribosomal protein L24
MRRFHVKRGDQVVVIAGTEKGKRGKIIALLTKKERVIVEGIKMIKRHTKKSQQHPQGAIVEREGSVHISNVMKAEVFDARASRRDVAPAA